MLTTLLLRISLRVSQTGKGLVLSCRYAVRVGHCPGVYSNWWEARDQVDGYSGAQHKGFHNYQDAQDYVSTYTEASCGSERNSSDGSYYDDVVMVRTHV